MDQTCVFVAGQLQERTRENIRENKTFEVLNLQKI